MEKKNIALCIILSIVTCGIYGVIWFVTLTNDIRRMAQDEESFGGFTSWLLSVLTCGIYGCFWSYKMGEKISYIKQQRGMSQDSSTAILYILLFVFGLSIVVMALLQNEVNNLNSLNEPA